MTHFKLVHVSRCDKTVWIRLMPESTALVWIEPSRLCKGVAVIAHNWIEVGRAPRSGSAKCARLDSNQ